MPKPKYKKGDIVGVFEILENRSSLDKEGYYLTRCLSCGESEQFRYVGNLTRTNGCRSCGQRKLRWKGSKRTDPYASEYIAWVNMCIRAGARNKTTQMAQRYKKDYWGRGININPLWAKPDGGFDQFMDEIGPKPSKEYVIDKRDNNKGYFLENVRWVTVLESNRNKRTVAKNETC